MRKFISNFEKFVENKTNPYLSFNEILESDGLYVSFGNFAEGVALQVENGVLSLIEYENPRDMFPKTLDLVITKSLVNDLKYESVLIKSKLWRK